MQARGLWDAVETGTTEYQDDRMALQAILRSALSDMLATLAVKKIAKEAWDTLKTMRMGADWVHQAKAQTLCKEFEQLKFKDGERVDDFVMRLNGLLANL